MPRRQGDALENGKREKWITRSRRKRIGEIKQKIKERNKRSKRG